MRFYEIKGTGTKDLRKPPDCSDPDPTLQVTRKRPREETHKERQQLEEMANNE